MFMRNLYYLRTFRGMPVRLHYTWIVAILLAIPILIEVVLPASAPELSGLARLGITALIVALFFVAVVLHECAHLFVAHLFGVRVSTLNLYPLGAITRMPARHRSARAAFWIAAAGPVLSIALWWILTALAAIVTTPEIALAIQMTAMLSLYLGLINLLPGLPLDGGRMGHVLIASVSGSFEHATRIMRICGQIIAYGLIALGISTMIGGENWPRALALIALGWAVREAGGTARRRALVAKVLHQLTAADVLTRPRRTIGPERSLRDFATSLRGRTGNQPTPVIANGMFLGMIDRALLREVPQGYWDARTVVDTMLPARSLDIIAPATPLSLLIPRLADLTSSTEAMSMPVVQEGRLLGLIDAEELLAILELEDEFGLFERGTPASWPAAHLSGSSAQAPQRAAKFLSYVTDVKDGER
jgi:Zn-dependent protease